MQYCKEKKNRWIGSKNKSQLDDLVIERLPIDLKRRFDIKGQKSIKEFEIKNLGIKSWE